MYVLSAEHFLALQSPLVYCFSLANTHGRPQAEGWAEGHTRSRLSPGSESLTANLKICNTWRVQQHPCASSHLVFMCTMRMVAARGFPILCSSPYSAWIRALFILSLLCMGFVIASGQGLYSEANMDAGNCGDDIFGPTQCASFDCCLFELKYSPWKCSDFMPMHGGIVDYLII